MPPLHTICPAVHTPLPPLTSIPPMNVLVVPLRVNPSLAKTIKGDPAAPNKPPVQENGPDTVIVMLPCRVPEDKLNEEGVRLPLPANETLPPLMMTGDALMVQVPSNLAVPAVKVFVPL